MAKVLKKKEEKVEEKKPVEFVTVKDIAVTVSENCEITLVKAKEVCDCMVDTIIGSIQEGYGVYLHGLGRINFKDMPSRKGRNPKTGESITIPAKTKITFKFAPTLKRGVSDGE